MENEKRHKNNKIMRSINFDGHWKLGEMGRVKQFNPTPEEYHRRGI